MAGIADECFCLGRSASEAGLAFGGHDAILCDPTEILSVIGIDLTGFASVAPRHLIQISP